jgi:uncharacterized protein (UPF0276 family)
MEFAVNYSQATSELLQEGQVEIDRFKCPSWPDLIATVQKDYSLYVHFSLRAYKGTGDVIDMETGQPVNWEGVEKLLAQTGTPNVNVHLAPSAKDYQDVPVDTVDPAQAEMLADHMIRDVHAVVERFGPERVIVENDHPQQGKLLRPTYLPEVICRVVEEIGCGFLLDVSHARLAALDLGMDVREYVAKLPTDRIREMHVAGVQRFDARWVEAARRFGIDEATIAGFSGCLVDHLPMTDEDWSFLAWTMEQVHDGTWAQPWIVTFEYSGVGWLFEAVTDKDVLAEQIPRLYGMIKNTREVKLL